MKQTSSNIFFFFLDGFAVLGLFGFRRKTKKVKGVKSVWKNQSIVKKS